MKFFSETFLLDGPVGKIEVMTTMPSGGSAKPITGIICHPHPLYGGTMHNKVVTTVAKAFEQLGVKTVRFNFRGVGKSEGHYSDAFGETDDAQALLEWVKGVCPKDEVWLAGFSFGSYIAAKLANRDSGVSRLITIAPPVDKYDYDVTNIVCPWLVLVGSEDELVPLQQVQAFVDQSQVPIRFVVMEKASHFFDGKLIELREVLIQECMGEV